MELLEQGKWTPWWEAAARTDVPLTHLSRERVHKCHHVATGDL